MKKILCLLLACILLAVSLCSCSKEQETQEPQVNETGNFAPENTAVPNSSIQDAANALSGIPVSEPDAAASPDAEASADVPAEDEGVVVDEDIFGTYDEATDTDQHDSPSGIDTSAYQFTPLSDLSLGFTFYYPSHWQNVPGIYTVCFQEQVEDGEVPARVAITRKKLTHTPDESDITDHLIAYLKTIYKQYDTSTFEVSGLDTSRKFMGKNGYSTNYLAFKGETEVEGFVIMCVVERTLYVYHFSASYSDFQSMETMMQYMCKSVTLVEK